jgi:hypothetical protein
MSGHRMEVMKGSGVRARGLFATSHSRRGFSAHRRSNKTVARAVSIYYTCIISSKTMHLL